MSSEVEFIPRTVEVRELQVIYKSRPDLPRLSATPLTVPGTAHALVRPLLEVEPVEVMLVVCLSTTHQVLAIHELSRGTLDMVTANPREIFKIALLANAAAVLIAHNHPSGTTNPSPMDRAATERIEKAGKLLGIELIDHLIIGAEGRYYSFHEHGLLR